MGQEEKGRGRAFMSGCPFFYKQNRTAITTVHLLQVQVGAFTTPVAPTAAVSEVLSHVRRKSAPTSTTLREFIKY